MVFRLIRQNKKATRWVYIIVTFFTMFTFSVTGAVYAWFHASEEASAETSAGSFVTPSGRKVEISTDEYRMTSMNLSRLSRDGFKESDQVWHFLMLDALADEAGIRISDEMLSGFWDEIFAQSGVPPEQRQEQYQRIIADAGLAAADCESLYKRMLRTQAYVNLFVESPRIRSQDVFQRFQDENELFTIEYVAFRDADFVAKVDRAAIPDADLQAYFDTDFDRTKRQRELSAPAEFRIDAAYLDIAKADVEKMKALLSETERTISELEIQRVYDERKDAKYKLPDAPVDPPKVDDPAKPADPAKPDDPAKPADPAKPDDPAKPADPAKPDDPAKPADPPAPKYRPLDEVKPEIEKELLAGRLLQKSLGEIQRRISDAAMKKAEKPAETVTDPNKPADPNAAPPTPVVEENHVKAVAEQFGLEYIEASPLTKWPDLATLPRLGSERLKQSFEFVSTSGAYPFLPEADAPFGFVAHVVEKVDPKPFPLAQVKDQLLEPYAKWKGTAMAQDAAKAFLDALRAAVRPKVQADIDKLETDAKARAATKATEQNVTDEVAKAKLVEDELKAIEGQINRLLDEHRHEAFDDTVKAQAVALESLGPFRESYSRTGFYRAEPKSTAKYLMGQFAIFSLDVGKVSDALRDLENEASYVVRVKDRRKPEFKEMSLADREMAVQSVDGQVRQADIQELIRGGANAQRSFQMYQQDPDRWRAENKYSFEKLSLLLNLQKTEKDKKEAPKQP